MTVKILLADKSITIQKVVEMLFSGKEYEVVCVSDGESALAEAQRVLPDVALVDVDLPRIDGYSFAARLRQIPALSQAPVILMMSRDDNYDAGRGNQAGIVDNIAKPFESQELIGKVKKALAAASPRIQKPAEPVVPAAPAPSPETARPKPAAPADIFDIISEAPTQAELSRPAVPDEGELVYEVEPVIEEVEEPLTAETARALPTGAEAVEEIRAGLGLDGAQAEIQPEPVSAPCEPADTAANVTETEETVPAAEAPAPAAPHVEPPPVAQPMMSEEELRRLVEDTITGMANEFFKNMTPPIPKISEDTVRRGITDAVTSIARELAREVIEKVAWEVIPDLAEQMIRAEIERLKAQE